MNTNKNRSPGKTGKTVVGVYLTLEEKAKLRAAAEAEGRLLSQWCRRTLLAAVAGRG